MIAGCRGTAWSEPRSPVGAGCVRIDGGCTATFRPRLRRAVGRSPTERALTAGTPHQALYRRWRAQTFSRDRRPGGGGRDAAQRGRDRQGGARDPVHRPARHRQDVARPDPRQGAQLREPRPQRGSRATSATRASPSARAARWTSSRSTPRRTAASTTIRELRERLNYAPTDLRRKVYILDEAHQITKDAWNALLKSLEEPPEFVTFMFASTHPQEFPPAILSRLQRFDVRRLTVAGDQRQARADHGGGQPRGGPGGDRARRAPRGGRDARRGVDPRPAPRLDRRPHRGRCRSRPARASPTRTWSTGSSTALATGDAAAGIALLDRLEERGRDLRVVPRPGRRRAPRAAARRPRRRHSGRSGPRARRPAARGHRPDAARRRRAPAPAGARAARGREAAAPSRAGARHRSPHRDAADRIRRRAARRAGRRLPRARAHAERHPRRRRPRRHRPRRPPSAAPDDAAPRRPSPSPRPPSAADAARAAAEPAADRRRRARAELRRHPPRHRAAAAAEPATTSSASAAAGRASSRPSPSATAP